MGLARPLMPSTPLESPALAWISWVSMVRAGYGTPRLDRMVGRTWGRDKAATDDIDLVTSDQADTGSATRDLFLILGV